MVFQPQTFNITVSGGVGAANTGFMRGLSRLIYCKPPTATPNASYTLTLTDNGGRIVWSTDGGAVATLRNMDPLPVQGIYTVNMSGVSDNGVYAFYMFIEERRM